jgi:hypothetical protein
MYDKNLLDKLKNELKSPKNEKVNEKEKRMCFLPLKKSEGSLKLRILPSIYNEQEVPGIIFKKHKNIPEHKSINCLEMYNLKCPICEVLNNYSNKTNTDEFEASAKAALNVLVLNDNSKNPNDPYILIATKKLLLDIIEFYFNPEIGDVTDIKTGVSLAVSREFDYGKLIITYARIGTPIADNDKKIQEILNNRYNLSEIWRTPTNEYIEKVKNCSISIEKELKRRLQISDETENILNTNEQLDLQESKSLNKNINFVKEDIVKNEIETELPGCFKNHQEGTDKCNLCSFEFQCIQS